MIDKVIVVGGGLAGVSACHTVLEHGGKVLLLDKSSFLGGNSTKATSGFNAAYTKTQILSKVPDSVEDFRKDIFRSANLGKDETPYELGAILADQSDSSFEWLTQVFKIDLSLVSRLGGHSGERTHRGKEKFPGMTITYGLITALEKIEEETKGEKARIVCKAKVTELVKEGDKVIGVKYEHKGQVHTEYGVVVLATGGFAADFEKDSLLMKYRPDLEKFSTTNGPHCTGDGLKMAQKVGGDLVDMEWIQVHPTGMINPKDPDNKVKWLAAEALRGVGGIIINRNGERFVDELNRRDYVSNKMLANHAPFRLVLSSGASKEIQWHCNHYLGRGVMKKFSNLKGLSEDMNLPYEKLSTTIDEYNSIAKAQKDPFGRKYFKNTPINKDELFHVALITPVVHYVMGGIKISAKCEALKGETPIAGLFAAGEVAGGVHGKNRLGGNSLAECVVFGRIAGRYASQYLLSSSIDKLKRNNLSSHRFSLLRDQMSFSKTSQTYSIEDVSKHNKANDCWVIIKDKVYDVSKFLEEHPGGADSIMAYAGGDATESFEMMHSDAILKKYGPDFEIGKVANKTSNSLNKNTLSNTQDAKDKPRGQNVPDYLVMSPSTEQSLVSGGTKGLLDAERKNVTFPISELTDEINGGSSATKRRKFVENMVSKDSYELMDRYNYTREEHVAEHTKDFIRIHKPYKNFRPTRMDIAYMSMATTATGALTNSHSIFLQTLLGQGSEEQAMFWGPKTLSFEICGSYAQTELGHGSNVRGLQTTATYDKSTEEFILNTPTLQSIKWWPGCLGKVATHVVLYAQLLIDGKECGLNVFVLQIRDENHLPLKGIRLGDLGTKIGDHGNDTGFMILDNVRVPREAMLCKFKTVTKEGEYITNKDIDPRVVYMTMISTRAMMVMTAGVRLAQAATIAIRYSLVRRQGFKNTEKGVSYLTEEHQIFDHKIQRYKLMKYLSQAYVTYFGGRWIIDFVAKSEGQNMGIIKDTKVLKEIMATSAGLKSYTSYMATLGIEELRKSCGGNGYLLHSGIASISCDYLWQVTAEGDFTILALLIGAHILKSLGKILGGTKLQGLMEYFNIIGEEEFHPNNIKPKPMKRNADYNNLSYCVELFKYRSIEKNIETAIEFNKRITKREEKFEVAFGNLATEIIKGVFAHCQYVMLKIFEERVNSISNIEVKNVMKKVALTYSLTQFLDDNWGEIIEGSQYRLIRNCLNEVLDSLRPDAIGLVDAFDFPDNVLKSTIGRYDGNIYEALFDAAQRSTLNQQDPYEGFKHLQPHTNKELLKHGNKPVLGHKF